MLPLLLLLFGAIVMLIIGSLEIIRSSKLSPYMLPELSSEHFRDLKRHFTHFGIRMCVAAIFLAFIPVTKNKTTVALLAAGWCGLLVTAIISQGRANKILRVNRLSYKTMVSRLKKKRS